MPKISQAGVFRECVLYQKPVIFKGLIPDVSWELLGEAGPSSADWGSEPETGVTFPDTEQSLPASGMLQRAIRSFFLSPLPPVLRSMTQMETQASS